VEWQNGARFSCDFHLQRLLFHAINKVQYQHKQLKMQTIARRQQTRDNTAPGQK
jgi:hypothetical protein